MSDPSDNPPAFDPDATMQMAQSAGKTFFGGRFELIEPIGRGAFGVVWKAKDNSLNNSVALKFLPDILRLDPEALGELREEAKRSLLLTHPNIVRVFDLHTDNDAAAIAMELVDGSSLSSQKAGSPDSYFEVDQVKAWVLQICQALQYAHLKAKVVHRDIKPQNVLLDSDGDAKVCDFGISRSVSDTYTRLSGATSFTPSYGSPEQAMGAPPDQRQDIYAVGALIYDLLTGKPPFFRGDVLAQLREIVPPSMAERRKEFGIEGKPIPQNWEETVAACLAKNPDDRPQTMLEVQEGLFGSGLPQHASKKKKSGVGAFMGVAVILLLFGGAGYITWSKISGDAKEPAPTVATTDNTSNAPETSVAPAATSTEPTTTSSTPETTPADTSTSAPSPLPSTNAAPQPGQNFTLEDVKVDMNWVAPLECWVSRTEITKEQFSLGGGIASSKFSGSKLAHDSVTWNQAMDYCEKLTAREKNRGRLPEGYIYTLPTEYQWEVFVADASLENAVYGLDEEAGPAEPGTKPPNLFGLVDVRGNLWEWTLDEHTPGDDTKGKALRGGAYDTEPKMVMDDNARFYGEPDNNYHKYGFRPVLTKAEPE